MGDEAPGASASELWLVVGLGNPGPGYAGSRHNVGFLVVDVLAQRMGAKFKSHKTRADVVEGRSDGLRVVLAKPRTFMNDSGAAVAALRDFFKVPLERVIIVHDELDLPYGGLRLKLGGGDNGHNGLKSLRKSLGSGEFYRVRFGVGRPPGRMDPASFVLRNFGTAEREDLELYVERAADAVAALIPEGLEKAQNLYNT